MLPCIYLTLLDFETGVLCFSNFSCLWNINLTAKSIRQEWRGLTEHAIVGKRAPWESCSREWNEMEAAWKQSAKEPEKNWVSAWANCM